MSSCPHNNVIFCPLYEAMHIPGAPSCDDGRLDENSCAIARGASYVALVNKLRAMVPGIVERNIGAEASAGRAAQRERNMRLGGGRP